jgi:thiol-disulfide isomerase/thioredoxin
MKSIKILICIFAVSAIGFAFTYDSSNPLDKNDWPRKRSTLVGNNIGDQAPELAVKNPDGKLIKLSSLKGKYVLIDFWASWCGPCRRENPNVVAAYAKYKEAKFKKAKGFEIYSVSLDKNMNAWKLLAKTDLHGTIMFVILEVGNLKLPRPMVYARFLRVF